MNLEISFHTDCAEFKKAFWEYSKYRIRSTGYIAIFRWIFIILHYLVSKRRHKRVPASFTYIFSHEAIIMKALGLTMSISYDMLSEYLSEEAFIILYINKKHSDTSTNKRKKRKYILPVLILTKEQREELLSILDFQMDQSKNLEREAQSTAVGFEIKADMSSAASKKSVLSFFKHEIKNKNKTFALKVWICIYCISATLLCISAFAVGISWSKELVVLITAVTVFMFFFPTIIIYLGYAVFLIFVGKQRIRVFTFTSDSMIILENNVTLIIPYHNIVKYINTENFILFHCKIYSKGINKKPKEVKTFIPTPELSASQKDMLSIMLGFIEADSQGCC